jgi:hypothetical protein
MLDGPIESRKILVFVRKILLSQNSKGKYESRKILVFVRKMRKKLIF